MHMLRCIERHAGPVFQRNEFPKEEGNVDAPLREAVKRAGGMRALGRLLGIPYQAVQKWKRTPATRVLELERLTKVPRYELRPDLYPPAEYRPHPRRKDA